MANTKAAIATAAAMCAVVGVLGGMGMAQGPATAPAPATATTSPAVMLEKGIYTEETIGDLDAAMKIYRQIVEDAKAARKYAAQAQYRLGMCYLKKRQSTEAVNCFKELITAFSDQKELVAKAREQIAKAREGMSDAEIARIVGEVVTSISTMADGDPRIPPLLASLRELKESAVVKELTKYFDSDKNTVRRSAIYVFWKGEFTDASPAVPGLVKLCSHEEDLTRGMAGIALGGMKADSAFDRLADMTGNDKSSLARRCAAYALGLLGKREARPILEKALKDPDQFVRNNAEAALTMLAKTSATGPAAPRAIKTTPEAFADDVDPSLDKITVTFDRPMMDKSWSFTAGNKAFSEKTGTIFPERAGEISYDAARTTCSMPVKLQPGKVYWVGVNSPSFQNFKSADGTPAERYLILFATKSADGKPTPLPADMVKQAKEINAAAQAVAGADEAQKAKLINWVEKFFSENYRDITARKTLQWGEPETTAGGNLAIRYKYLATIWDKDKQIIEQRFTFTPEGKYVSAETIEKGPAPADDGGAPRVVATTPAALANDVDPALGKITVTFDRPMMDKSWSWTGGGDTFPESAGNMSYDANRTTCTMPVKLQPGKVYWVGINSPSHKNFKSADGTPAARYVLLFATKSADGKPTPLPQNLLKEAKEVNAASRAGGIASYAVELKDNWALDLDTGKSVQLEKDWADAYEVAWDNDIGGTLMIKPQSQKVRIMAVPEASDLESAVRKALEPDMPRLLALSQERGVPAKRSRFAAVLTDQGQIAVIEVSRFTPKDALLQCVVGSAAAQPAVAGERDQQSPLAEARQVGLAFLQLLQAGQAQPALALTTPDYRKAHPKGFDELAKRIDFSSAKVADVLASPDSACVTLSGVVPPGRKESMSLGLGLHREGGKLLIRDVDALPNENAKQEFIAGFQRSLFAAEPARRGYIDPVYLRHAEELSVEGWALWNQRKLAEAEEKFKTAVAMDPTNANAFNGLGWAQQNQGKALNAKTSFEQAVALNPKLPGALNGLGWVAKSQGKTEDAIEYWKKAVAAAPAATAALNGLATTYSELGQYDKSIEAYQQWLKAEPDNKDAKAGLKKAQESVEAVKAAVPAAEQWLKLVDDGKYGECWDAAAEFLRKAVGKDVFGKQIAAARTPLGKLQSRKVKLAVFMTSLPGAPDGQYVVIQFEASFENKKQAVETVTPMKDKDGKWRVSGYYIK
jgi:tetratricopeptide (TPR) repeat protein